MESQHPSLCGRRNGSGVSGVLQLAQLGRGRVGIQTQAGPGSSPGPILRARLLPSKVWLCGDLGLTLILPHRLQELRAGAPTASQLFLPCPPPSVVLTE